MTIAQHMFMEVGPVDDFISTAGSREQGAGSREQGAWSREQGDSWLSPFTNCAVAEY